MLRNSVVRGLRLGNLRNGTQSCLTCSSFVAFFLRMPSIAFDVVRQRRKILCETKVQDSFFFPFVFLFKNDALSFFMSSGVGYRLNSVAGGWVG